MKDSRLPPSLWTQPPWQTSQNPIWLASSFLLRRNIASCCFPGRATAHALERITADLRSLAASSLEEGSLFLTEVSHWDRELLFERFLCLEHQLPNLPGRAWIVDAAGTLLVEVHGQDHLHFHAIDCKGEWDQTYARLAQLERTWGSQLPFAYTPRFGYLTADVGQSGTALTAYVFLHLPALLYTKQWEEIAVKQREEGVAVTSLEGDTERFVGGLVVLYNRYTLGVAEESILRSLYSQAMKWMAAEKTFRRHIAGSSQPQLKDAVSRALGLLLHSYQLQTKETLDELSLIKLGVDLEWIRGVDHAAINRCFFYCRRAHLMHLLEAPLADSEELPRRRAERIQSELKGMELTM